MNVFIGKNGSGKTAILEAANVILGAYLAAFKTYVPSRYVYNISRSDVHLKSQMEMKDVLTTGGIRQYPCQVSGRVNWGYDDGVIEFQRVLLKENARTKFGGSNPMQKTVVEWEAKIAQANHSDQYIVLPIVLYLSSARLWNESSAKESGVYSRTDAYNRCLDAKHGISMAFNYINQLQAVALEERNGRAYRSYQTILDAVNFALKDELGEGESVIFSSRYENDMVALKTNEGTIVPFSNLSDGYRNVVKIILDIATRMCILNPYLEDRALKETSGVVVIDEIDLSLHPTWQKRIIGILKDLFPKVQFICATHSPFIIQSLENGELVNLDVENEDEYSGESIEDIAEDIMGVKMPQYSDKKIKMYEAATELLNAVNESRSKDDIKEIRHRLNLLEAQYGDNPAYLALLEQKVLVKEAQTKKYETN